MDMLGMNFLLGLYQTYPRNDLNSSFFVGVDIEITLAVFSGVGFTLPPSTM